MNWSWADLAVGLFIGAAVGIMIGALLAASNHDDDDYWRRFGDRRG